MSVDTKSVSRIEEAPAVPASAVRIQRESGTPMRNECVLQASRIGAGCILYSLIGVMDLWGMLEQRAIQRLQCQTLIQTPSQMPATNAAREDIHDDRKAPQTPRAGGCR